MQYHHGHGIAVQPSSCLCEGSLDTLPCSSIGPLLVLVMLGPFGTRFGEWRGGEERRRGGRGFTEEGGTPVRWGPRRVCRRYGTVASRSVLDGDAPSSHTDRSAEGQHQTRRRTQQAEDAALQRHLGWPRRRAAAGSPRTTPTVYYPQRGNAASVWGPCAHNTYQCPPCSEEETLATIPAQYDLGNRAPQLGRPMKACSASAAYLCCTTHPPFASASASASPTHCLHQRDTSQHGSPSLLPLAPRRLRPRPRPRPRTGSQSLPSVVLTAAHPHLHHHHLLLQPACHPLQPSQPIASAFPYTRT